MSAVSVRTVEDPAGLRDFGALLLAYADEHGWGSEPAHVDEVSNLPGEYAPPAGAAFVAYSDVGEPIGCLALRPATSWLKDAAELRRLYVVPRARRRGVARALVEAAQRWARMSGYSRLVLVSLSEMSAAHRLYESLGFEFVDAYRASTADHAVYMAKRLSTEGDGAPSRA